MNFSRLASACMLPCAIAFTLARPAPDGVETPSADTILSRVESETNRRHLLLKEYYGSRQYVLRNSRFGKQAAVELSMSFRQIEGERYTINTRSGSDQLNNIIDRVLASEASESLPRQDTNHQISALNYHVRLLGSEVTAGRSCYILGLVPRVKNRYLILGKAWVDTGSYAVVRMEGQFAASMSALVGAPHINEEFIEFQGFWLPGHVRSITSSLLLGPTELDISFSNYQSNQESAPKN